MKGDKMNSFRMDGFQEWYSQIKSRFELIELEKKIMNYMDTDEHNNLTDKEKYELDDLLMHILNKRGYYKKGCDPWNKIFAEI